MFWVLVTGGTGTVGSALVRELLSKGQAVRVLARDEGRLAELGESLKMSGVSPDRFRCLVGDVRDRDRLCRAAEGVSRIFHAAALKRVDSCEYNPEETIKTNILGVQNVIDCATASGVEAVINMSSDKAAAPSNLMGASKLVGERLVAYANAYGRGCRFMSVRFGNILGSRGSVLPLWQEQMRRGFVRVTDPQMTRYVMSARQAIDLCLLASRDGIGGEVFVLAMPVIRLGTLAKVVVGTFEREHEQPLGSVKVEIVGLRPGETLDETIVTDEEAPRTAACKGFYAVLPNISFGGRKHKDVYPVVGLEKGLSSSEEPVLDTEQTRGLLKEWRV